MSPYEEMVCTTVRIKWLLKENIPAPSDIGVTFFYRRSVIVAKGERIDSSTLERLSEFWDRLAYSYFQG